MPGRGRFWPGVGYRYCSVTIGDPVSAPMWAHGVLELSILQNFRTKFPENDFFSWRRLVIKSEDQPFRCAWALLIAEDTCMLASANPFCASLLRHACCAIVALQSFACHWDSEIVVVHASLYKPCCATNLVRSLMCMTEGSTRINFPKPRGAEGAGAGRPPEILKLKAWHK